jgi:hypothetical protein
MPAAAAGSKYPSQLRFGAIYDHVTITKTIPVTKPKACDTPVTAIALNRLVRFPAK